MKAILLCAVSLFTVAYSGERNVLVEMFTNSHCPVCPPAHTTMDSYASSSANASKLRYIFYHTLFPYSDDQLAQANTTEPVARYNYYGVSSSTPITFFDGVLQGSYSTWTTQLDNRFGTSSPLDIELTGSKNGNDITIAAIITKTETIGATDLVVHIVAVEDVSYVGRNGVSPQKFVMRKMLTPSAGQEFVFDDQNKAEISSSLTLSNVSNVNSAGIVVFVQSISTKEVFQSEYISYSTLTGVEDETSAPVQFTLHQNYPNPFNPSTTIDYSLPEKQFITLAVVDMLGRTITTVVNSLQAAGRHSVIFNAENLPSGIYFYTLRTEKYSVTKKMLFQK